MSNVINGIKFEKMMRNALNNIFVHEKEINDMNVFPVADGDTGTNMRLTLENGLNHAESDSHLGKYLKSLSTGMLLGARGNSGVILSQIFKGMYESLKNDSIVNPGEFRDAFINGYRTAYKAVLKPVEGTILTVCRLGIENIRYEIKGKITMVDTFKMYLDELNKSLELTPKLLPALKEANVLDSGAKGYIVIIEGMYYYLLGKIIERDVDLVIDENNEIKEESENNNYNVELIIKNNNESIYLEISEKLQELSSSFSIKIDNGLFVIKASTDDPTPLISCIRKYGEVKSINIENRKTTAPSNNEKEIPFKAIVYLACINGEGIKNIYQDMGVDVFLSMNPSTQDFLDKLKIINAERVVVLPNDKNILETARQAVRLSGLDNVKILSTNNVIEGYYALAMDVPDSSLNNRLNAIQEEVGVITINISKAIKEYSNEFANIKIDDYVAYKDDSLLSGNKDLFICLDEALNRIENINSISSAFILLGKNVDEEMEEKLSLYFSQKYESIEITVQVGGQEKEELIIGLL